MKISIYAGLCLILAVSGGCAKKDAPATVAAPAPSPSPQRSPARAAPSPVGMPVPQPGFPPPPQVAPLAPGEVRATDMLAVQRTPESRQRLAQQAAAVDERLAQTERGMRQAAGESPAAEVPETPQQLEALRVAALELRRSVLEGKAAGIENGTASIQSLMRAMPLSKARVTRDYVKATLTLDLGVVHPEWGNPVPVPNGPLGLPQNDPLPPPAPGSPGAQ